MTTAPGGGFASLLRSYRRRAALTQEELAERAGLAVTAVSALERGLRTRPYPHTVRALAAALDLTDAEREGLTAAVPPRARTAEADAGGPAGVVGRDVDAERVAGLLGPGRARLVTLTGPGGVGKTTLARAVAARLRTELGDDATVLDAGELTSPEHVLAALAARLGLAETADPVDGLAERLRGRPRLVVLDTLEHVLGVGRWLVVLLDRCPDLRLLATSRAPLRLRAEHEVVVPPLPVPDAWLPPDPGAVGAAPAVRLLLERCAQRDAAVELTPGNAAVVAELSRRTDGLPLAIELVAAQARVLPLEVLLGRLDQALRRPGPRDLPERQRTLGATLEWSLSLVDARERAAFATLAVFAGSISLAAAESLLGPEALEVLADLVEQSLLVPVDGPDARFRMLHPLRQHAAPRVPPEAAGRHAEFFLEAARATWPRLRGAELTATLDGLDLDGPDLLAAHTWLVAQERAEDAVDLVHGVAFGVLLRGHAREWRDRVDLAATGRLAPLARARALVSAGLLDYALARRSDAAAALGRAAGLVDEHDLAAADPALAAECALWGGLVAVNLGDAAQGAARAETLRRDPSAWGRAFLRLLEGQLALLAGDLDAAAEVLQEGWRAALELGNPLVVAVSLNMRATVAERREDLEGTTRLLLASVEESAASRLGWPFAFALPALAGVAMRRGEPEVAGRLLGAAASVVGSPTLLGVFPASRGRAEADLGALRARLGPRFAETVDAGRLLQPDDVVGLARTLVRTGG
ncbi:ATP-binding protein [Phycicoccus flavus]|uniref:ATP-binding protein n=1 Tax=Phycicoccus flavus TaxID=2502783 RepID=UPI000FEBBD26|nr:helix-turn-helix domain-containing protein [Phycicoccus flavus]NHA66741.1 helix-turn-helix domain-containing protein [Phycicoccus flavus]